MPFRSTNIPFSETGQFSKLFLDYVHDAERVRPFYTHRSDLQGFADALRELQSQSFDRETLAAVFEEQEAEQLAKRPELARRIGSLRSANTFTVCTGHQLCIFTGPLFFIYKIISVINLAEALKKQFPQNDFVPVYWMASEDHDFEEISSVNLFGKKISWQAEAGGPVGRMSTASLQPVLAELKTVLGDSPAAQELFAVMAAAYDGKVSLAVATRRLAHTLFGKYGLLILDGDDARLKKIFLPQISEELLNQPTEKTVLQESAALEKAGYAAQVNPRPVNLFYHSDTSRERIEKNGDQYRVLGTDLVFSKAEITDTAEKHPERFSPNVVTRPLYQQMILPNIAYVGGPGELAYWLQYKTMFGEKKLFFPVLVPRNFAMIIDKGSQERMQKLGIAVPDLFGDTEELVKNYVRKNSSATPDLSEEKEKLKSVFAAVISKATAVDATLQKSAEAELQKSINALDAFESKLLKAEKQKHETATSQLRKLKEKFLPGGSLHERHDNFMPYALAGGYEKWIDELKEALQPFHYDMLLLEVSG
ncbi:MAG: UPF0747 protein [Bacteroidetes bacterium]|nr:MAG: UPF0747 protein [Bacteroidota bacterium]